MFRNIRFILGVVIICICIAFVFLILKGNITKGIICRIKSWHRNCYVKRRKNLTAQLEQSGIIKEKGLMIRLDKLIEESGLKHFYSYMSGELFLISIISMSILIGIIVYLLFGNVFSSVLAIIGIVIGCFGVAYIFAGNRYKKTERQLLLFINLMENYSRTSDDLVEIIGRTESYLDEPLKSVIARFHWECGHTGEIGTALGHLKIQLPNRKLQEIIHNLDICRRHEANYEEVIKDMRVSVQEYLKSKEERKNIQQTSKGNVMVMMLVGVFIIKMVDKFIDGGVLNLLSSNIIGILILIYMFTLVLFGVWQFIKVDRN